ncbi:inactive serine/threonine-protein kinase 19-like [Liolophura sinensis]|uniref:inactive serine/threonine-protein kinase 19-like n=1 Tax=Liolophura sinensis TaxID=3198878 RepID=UPI00315874E1
MSRKRSHIPEIYKQRKRIFLGPAKVDSGATNGFPKDEKDVESDEILSDTKATLFFLRGLFPVEKFHHTLPAMILKHQVYSIVKNRTVADKQLNDLRTAGEIKLFKLPMGTGEEEYCVLFTEDYKSHILRTSRSMAVSKTVIDKFIKKVVSQHSDVSISKETLLDEFRFKDEEITQMVKANLLTFREVGSWWLSIPNTGVFMKSFIRGRKSVLTMIRKSKYRAILKQELEQRKWPKLAKLGLMFHIHDIIGSELVECVQTTSGELLRLKDN